MIISNSVPIFAHGAYMAVDNIATPEGFRTDYVQVHCGAVWWPCVLSAINPVVSINRKPFPGTVEVAG
jgi:hypothetical protein